MVSYDYDDWSLNLWTAMQELAHQIPSPYHTRALSFRTKPFFLVMQLCQYGAVVSLAGQRGGQDEKCFADAQSAQRARR